MRYDDNHRITIAPGNYYKLNEALNEVGLYIENNNNEWYASDPTAVAEFIASYDPLPAARADKWLEIKAERDRRQRLGVVVNGSRFHSDDASRIQQLGLVLMGDSIPSGLQWKTMDGTFVNMTPTLAQQIFNATAVSDTSIFAAAEVHKANMLASDDPQNYDFSTGWPGE